MNVGCNAFYVFFALAAFLAGFFVADPIPVHDRLGEERIWHAGGRLESFPGPARTRLSVWEIGRLSAGDPVVLQHGLGATALYFARTGVLLHRETGRTVLLPDAPGSGRSGKPARDEGYGLRARVAALDALVKSLALEKVDLVGHSLGGWAAAAWALENPRRIGRLVLVDSAGFTPPGPDGAEAMRARFLPVDRSGARDLVAALFFRQGSLRSGFLADALGRGFRGEAVSRTVRALHEGDAIGERVAELPEGTVFLWGEKDAVFPLEDARRAAARVRGSRLLVITGVGHDPAIEAPRRFLEALSRALAR